MPSTKHKIITLILGFTAIALLTVSHYYQQHHAPASNLDNAVWEYKYRGYPNQFGYLNHHWGIRIIDVHSQVVTQNNQTTQAMAFKLYGQSSLIGEFTIQFDANWQATREYLDLEVIKSSLALTHVSPELDAEALKPFLTDMLNDMYATPREIISVTPNSLVIDIPYMGMIRATRIQEARLIQ